MFDAKTVFILGAGASHDVGLPTGSALALEIGKKLDIRFEQGTKQICGDFAICDAYRLHAPGEINEFRVAGISITNGIALVKSIDDFLDNHRDKARVQLCGKLGIARAISQAEHKSSLSAKTGESIKFENLADTWFVKFFRLLSEGVRATNLEKLFTNVAFINFNYDRCLEHFLFHALRQAYGINEGSAAEAMASLQVIHPYGSIGELDWQRREAVLPYGTDAIDPHILLGMVDHLRTYTERLHDVQEVARIQTTMAEARNLVFLGFGFHPQNLELIKPAHAANPKRIFGTTLGISAPNREIISTKLKSMFQGPVGRVEINLESSKCDGLLDTWSWQIVSA